MKLPKHKGSLTITHNEHKGWYQTLADHLAGDLSSIDISEEERLKAIELDSLWVIQWYPDTPVGFCCVGASTLEKALELATEDTK